MQTNKIIIVDLDGTLIDIQHRLPPIKQEPKNWDAHRDNYHLDKPIPNIITLYKMLELYQGWNNRLILLTARMEREREPTVKWLATHNINYDQLIMRPNEDHRKDLEYKEEQLLRLQSEGYEILFAIDDRTRVVEMFRRNGITCLQVANGDY